MKFYCKLNRVESLKNTISICTKGNLEKELSQFILKYHFNILTNLKMVTENGRMTKMGKL